MKRTPLSRRVSLSPGKGLERKRGLSRGAGNNPTTTKPLRRGRGFAASPAQQKKAREEPCVATAQEALYGATVDAAHLWPRGRGGCADPLCTVPLVRDLHREFDEGKFDLLPHLVKRRVPELCHALEHADGNVEALFRRLAPLAYRAMTGEREGSPSHKERISCG